MSQTSDALSIIERMKQYMNPRSWFGDNNAGMAGALNPAGSEFLRGGDIFGDAAFGGGAGDPLYNVMGQNAGGGDPSLMDRAFGYTDADGSKSNGFVMPALGVVSGLGNTFLGMKQYGLAKDQLKFEKEAFNKNFEAQRNMTNSQMADRQRARVAANPGAHRSEAEYMSKFGV
ncbi:MAG TPA: hypothetical protein VIG24_12015 [Acidimicrobiia bacterium]